MRRVLVIAATELRRRVRSRAALVTAFLGPLAMATVLGLLVTGTGEARFTFALVDEDGSATSTGITAGLDDLPPGTPITFRRLTDRAAATAAVDDGDVDAAVVVPAGFGAAATAGNPLPLAVLRAPERMVSGQVARSVADGIAARFDQVDLAVRALLAQGRPPDEGFVGTVAGLPPAYELAEAGTGGRPLTAPGYFGTSMSILFLFFTVGFAARSLIAERREGTLARVLASPTGPGHVIAGKTLAVAVLGLAGFATVWVVTTFAFGATWGDPASVVALMVATVLSIGGIATFVASLARTPAQADAISSAVAFALALLGGNFLGPGAAPELLARLALLTPNGWALRGFTDVAVDAATTGELVRTLAVLTATGVGFGAVGVARIHRVVRA